MRRSLMINNALFYIFDIQIAAFTRLSRVRTT